MQFPLIEAILQLPPEGKDGKLGIFTITMAPGMVLNEIPFEQRDTIVALGSLVVSRDGAERMIVNSLVHPGIEYLILFGEETNSFRPSTNLLYALMHGYDAEKQGNRILNGKGVSPQYPSISPDLLQKFREKVKVIPLFWGVDAEKVVMEYLDWEKDLPESLKKHIKEKYAKKKIYYDALLETIALLREFPKKTRSIIALDAKEFQHLQPPIEQLSGKEEQPPMPFRAEAKNGQIHLEVEADGKIFSLEGGDSFLMAYALNERFKENNFFSPLQQLLMGAELSRVEMELKLNDALPAFVQSEMKSLAREEIPLPARTVLMADNAYYYKINIKHEQLCVQSMAHDTCAMVYEWRSATFFPLLQKVANENRFQSYAQSMLHRADIGIEMARAAIALKYQKQFLQDFHLIYAPNYSQCPLIIAEGDSFLGVHQQVISKLYTSGVSMPHADTQKGTMYSGAVLAIFRDAEHSLQAFPGIYAAGSLSTEEMRRQYAEELSSPLNNGAYTYGNRTRAYFGRDQLVETVELLKKNSHAIPIIQRFDYVEDMTLSEEAVKDANGNITRTRLHGTHDPCLTHDMYFIQEGKLHALHIARAHNIVNAYPENVFGLHDAYDRFIARELQLPLGDMFVLSNRANVLPLTEEQKAKRLMAEPSKPVESHATEAGPHSLERNESQKGIAWKKVPLHTVQAKPMHPCVERLENYRGTNILEKAVHYLKKRGATHNNPILGCYDPKNPVRDASTRLIFFQCNQQGDKLFASAVFSQTPKEMIEQDIELCHYLATRFATELNLPLGELVYVCLAVS